MHALARHGFAHCHASLLVNRGRDQPRRLSFGRRAPSRSSCQRRQIADKSQRQRHSWAFHMSDPYFSSWTPAHSRDCPAVGGGWSCWSSVDAQAFDTIRPPPVGIYVRTQHAPAPYYVNPIPSVAVWLGWPPSGRHHIMPCSGTFLGVTSTQGHAGDKAADAAQTWGPARF